MLSRLALMVQAAVLDGQFFDLIPPFDDGGVAAKVGVDRRDVAETLVVAVVVIVIDESADCLTSAPRITRDPPVSIAVRISRTRGMSECRELCRCVHPNTAISTNRDCRMAAEQNYFRQS